MKKPNLLCCTLRSLVRRIESIRLRGSLRAPRILGFLIRVCAILLITTSAFARSSDEVLAKKVRDAIILTPNVFDGFLKISAQNGVIYLKGRVLSERDKEMAQSVARGVVGVVDVITDVEVRPLTSADADALRGMQGRGVIEPVIPYSSGKTPASPAYGPSRIKSSMQRMREQQDRADDDNRIRRDVEFAIQMEVGLPRVQSVYVSVTDGVVTLNGIVDDRFVRYKVEDTARRVRGVKRVSSQILVR